MSMVLLEAMAAGKAIVTTSVGETPKIINNDKCGVVLEPGNIEKMVLSLESFIENRALIDKFGESARVRYEENFTAAKMSSRYETLYQTIINK
jgi:glycosyltransferase involved in cell wall biosynthesis